MAEGYFLDRIQREGHILSVFRERGRSVLNTNPGQLPILPNLVEDTHDIVQTSVLQGQIAY